MQSCSRGGAMPSKKPSPAIPTKAVLRKGAWTHEEDLLLRRCIEKYGEGKWRQVPQRAGLQRCRKSCRLRWLNYLRPNLKRGDFAEDEIDLILRLHKLLGNKWSLIAGRIPGRTANDIKNYWNAHLRKTLAARCSALAKAAQGSGGGANGGAGKTSLEKRAHATTKSYDRDMTNTLDVLPPSTTTPTKATSTSRSKATTFTVIKPQPRTLTASIRLATTPSSEPVGMASSTDHCTPAPLQIITDFSDVLVPEGSVSPIPPSPEDQIAMWWDGVLDGLVPSGDGLLWGSGSERHPPVGAIFEDQVFWGNQEEDEQQQQPDYVSHQPVIGN